jgi:DNA-binding NtrC family response regulator
MAKSSRRDNHKPRVLVAEDEMLIAMDLQDMLERLGYEVVGPAGNVAEIRDLLQDGPIDGAILDVNLRGEQVFSVLPALMAIGMPVVLASGYEDAQLFPSEFRDLPRITKPFSAEAVKTTCAACFPSNGKADEPV